MDRESAVSGVSRRTLLGVGGGALATALAGCTGGGGGGTTRFHTAFEGGRPATRVHFNPFNPADYAQTYSIYWLQTVLSPRSDGSVTSEFFEDLSVDGRDVTITMPEGFTFWNGDEITAEDYYVEAELTRYQDPEGSPIAGHEMVDDYTVRRTYKNDISPTVARANAGYGVGAPASRFGSWLDRYEEAGTADERNQVTEELLRMTIPTEEFVEEGLGSSLFEIDDFNSSETLAVKRDDHPWSDRTDIEEIRVLPNVEAGTQVDQLARNNELDMIDYVPESRIDEYPDDIANVYELSHYNTQKFMLNWNNPHLSERAVRRAIIAAIDIPAIVDAANQAGVLASPTQVQTGIRETIETKYLGEGFTDDLIQYPVEADEEAAVAYMESADYTREDGSWVSPDGEPVSFDIITQSAVEQSQQTNVFSDQLNQFGFDTELSAIGQNYYSQVQEYEFDIAWMWNVALPYWHPMAYFSNNFYGILAGDPDSGNETGPTGIPFELQIPSEVGAERADGGETIRPAALMEQLARSSSAEETQELTRTLVRWVNYDLPAVIHLQENRGFAGDTANFQFPDPEQVGMDRPNPGPWALSNGHVSTSSN